ncbi:MAG: SPOR domain-containing protein [bacterium]
MADDELEGFEDFTGGDAAADDAGGAGFDSNLEDIFNTGDEDAGGGMDAFDGDMGGDDAGSSLDTFFEDLSTIDDLEVLQQDDEEEAPAPDDSEIEVGGTAVVATEEEEAKPEKPKKEKKPKEPGAIKRWIKRGMWLAAVLVIGFFIWSTIIPNFSTYFETAKEWIAAGMEYLEGEEQPEAPPEKEKDGEMQADTGKTPPPLPRPEKDTPPTPRVAAKPPPPPKTGPWSIQVATCFFPSCLDGFKNYLSANKRSVIMQAKTSQSHSLEIFSISRFNVLEDAQQIADRVNKGNPMEGHAYTYRENGSFRVSMGRFQDLARAKVVKNALNRQFAGEIVFSTRAKHFPYKVQSVMTGKYPSRSVASRALARLKDRHPRFQDAFVVERRK